MIVGILWSQKLNYLHSFSEFHQICWLVDKRYGFTVDPLFAVTWPLVRSGLPKWLGSFKQLAALFPVSLRHLGTSKTLVVNSRESVMVDVVFRASFQSWVGNACQQQILHDSIVTILGWGYMRRITLVTNTCNV